MLRANRIGDFVFAIPALSALRAAYPRAELVLLGLPWHKELLPDRTVVDRVIEVPSYPGVRDEPPHATPEELDTFFASMADERFDLAIQMHGGGRHSNPFVSRLGATRTLGFRDLDAPPLDQCIPYFYYQNEYARYLELVAQVGATSVDFQTGFTVLPGDREAASRYVDPASSYAVLIPGATDPRRRWEPARFAQIGDWLAARGMQVLIGGAPDEAEIGDEIVTLMEHPARSIAGDTSLTELLGVIAGATIVISNDTGPLHIAISVGTPSVGIYWCGNLVNAAPFGRARHMPVASWMVTCPLCGEDMATVTIPPSKNGACEHRANFTDAASPDQVMAAAGWVLGDPYR